MANLNNEYLVINGRDSRDFGIYLIDGNIFDFAIRDYETFQVMGRTGDVNLDHGRWRNITITFKCAAIDNSREKLDMWRAFLLSGMGAMRETEHALTAAGILYQGYYGSYKIETSIEPEIYRIGMLKSVSSPELSLQGGGGYVEVSFDCQPQKYLKSGAEKMSITANIAKLYNPTYYDARPLIKVKASASGGYIQFRSFLKDEISGNEYEDLDYKSKITINTTDTFYIDCETRNASADLTNYNSNIELTGLDFPVIAGTPAIPNVRAYTSITISNMETVEMQPKWWTL